MPEYERDPELRGNATRADIHRLRQEMQTLVGNLSNEIKSVAIEVRQQNGRVTRVEDHIKLSPAPTDIAVALAQFRESISDFNALESKIDEAARTATETKEHTAMEVAKTNGTIKFGTGAVAVLILVANIVPWDKVFG